MLLKETVAVYFEHHEEYTNVLCGWNLKFWYVKTDGMHSKHWVLKCSLSTGTASPLTLLSMKEMFTVNYDYNHYHDRAFRSVPLEERQIFRIKH
jgi:hypothetical protein